MVKPPTRHKEYDNLPFVLISNAKVPGQPTGRSDLYDVEQILREKDERLTQAAQMIHQVIRGQMWQLVGPDAPDDVPANAIPQPNKVATPGSGNEIRTIQPFMPQFAVEDFLTRLDREAATITGLNDLLLGLAPAGALNSSKAIAALTANFVARVNPKRKLLYRGYRDIWDMAATIWERKSTDIRAILDGQHRISIKAPDLTPRDELETAQMAVNLIQNRIWSSERGMDATGVEDPSEEKGLIREEQTDASLNPAAVQAMAQLMVVFQQLGIDVPPEEVGDARRQISNRWRLLALEDPIQWVGGLPGSVQPELARVEVERQIGPRLGAPVGLAGVVQDRRAVVLSAYPGDAVVHDRHLNRDISAGATRRLAYREATRQRLPRLPLSLSSHLLPEQSERSVDLPPLGWLGA